MIQSIWNTILFAPIHNFVTGVYAYTNNLGASLVIVILIIRFILAPLSIKQYRDTQKLNDMKPLLDELKAKYKDSPEQLALEQQKLYKQIGYNPLGCAINLLIQFPILIALYQSIITFTKFTPQTVEGLYPFVSNLLATKGIETFNTTLFNMNLMTAPFTMIKEAGGNIYQLITPIIFLLLLAGTNLVPGLIAQAKMKATKKAKDDLTSEEVFAQSLNNSTVYIMPVMITFAMGSLASLLGLYIIIQNLVGISQQLAIKYFLKEKPVIRNGELGLSNKEVITPEIIESNSKKLKNSNKKKSHDSKNWKKKK